MKEGFKSINEILLEVAEEEGMTERDIKDLWKHQIKYTQQQMDTDGVYAIFLPFIGTLSLNVKQLTAELKGKNKRKHKKIINKVENLKNHENYTKYRNSHKKITGVNRLARYIISKYNTGLDRSKNLLTRHKCWEIISKYSNGNFEKREEPIKRLQKNE